MLASTRGIVFHTLPYSDTTVISRIYTEAYGLRSYLVNAAHSRRSASKARLLQPLSLVELVAYEKENRGLQRIREIRTEVHYINREDIRRSSILLFLDEVLCQVIREEEKNPLLFEFLHSSLQILDVLPGNPSNFHLSFLLQLSKYLGFFPHGNYSEFCPWFDLKAGEFVPEEPAHPLHLDPAAGKILGNFLFMDYGGCCEVALSGEQRRAVLHGIISYYGTHVEGFPSLKSVQVLEEVLGELA
ncbi:MAG: DNA repair protein RecO [Bacteroidia bacterium]|nr:DNA repair protein RecO [Bacteroidia bacterium]